VVVEIAAGAADPDLVAAHRSNTTGNLLLGGTNSELLAQGLRPSVSMATAKSALVLVGGDDPDMR
jgi:hypothetical protein